jgi:hypothetical protein
VAGYIEGHERHGDEIEVTCAPPLVAGCRRFFDAERVAPHDDRCEWATALRCRWRARHGREAQQAETPMGDDRQIDRATALPSEAHEFSRGELFA